MNDRVPSIRRFGLGGLRGAPKAFRDCPDGVYLAEDPMLALGFLLERALAGDFKDISTRDAVSQFSVFVIDDSRVDRRRLVPDPNIQQAGFWLYNGVVDVTAMPVIGADEVTSAHFKLTGGGEQAEALGARCATEK